MKKPFKKLPHKTFDSALEAQKGGVRAVNEELVRFSFKYLSKANSKFDFSDSEADYFIKLLDRLKDLSTMTLNQFCNQFSKSLRNHSIDWSDTTERAFGLPNEAHLVEQPFQFSVSSNQYGRVIGFFVEATFYVVWLDRARRLYA
jgi:hypothetical protein